MKVLGRIFRNPGRALFRGGEDSGAYLPPPSPGRPRTSFQKTDEKREGWVIVEHSDINDLIKWIENKTTDLSHWEMDFLISIKSQLPIKRGLTQKQYATLVKIAEKVGVY